MGLDDFRQDVPNKVTLDQISEIRISELKRIGYLPKEERAEFEVDIYGTTMQIGFNDVLKWTDDYFEKWLSSSESNFEILRKSKEQIEKETGKDFTAKPLIVSSNREINKNDIFDVKYNEDKTKILVNERFVSIYPLIQTESRYLEFSLESHFIFESVVEMKDAFLYCCLRDKYSGYQDIEKEDSFLQYFKKSLSYYTTNNFFPTSETKVSPTDDLHKVIEGRFGESVIDKAIPLQKEILNLHQKIQEERVYDYYRFEVFSPVMQKECEVFVNNGYLKNLGNGRFSFTEKCKREWQVYLKMVSEVHSDLDAFFNINNDYPGKEDEEKILKNANRKLSAQIFADHPKPISTDYPKPITKIRDQQQMLYLAQNGWISVGGDPYTCKYAPKDFRETNFPPMELDQAYEFLKYQNNDFAFKVNPNDALIIEKPKNLTKTVNSTKSKKFFYDTKFLEGTQKKRFLSIPYGNTAPTIDLISIGIVSDDGSEYYAVSKEFNLFEAWNRYDVLEQTPYEKANGFSGRKKYWIRENVLYPIFYELFKQHNKMEIDNYFGNLNNFIGEMERPESKKYAFKKFKSLIKLYGKSKEQIAEEVYEFCIDDYLDTVKTYKLKKESIELWGYYSDYDHVVFCWLFGKMLDLPEGFPKYTKDLKQSYDFYNKNFRKRKALSAVMPHLVDFENLKEHPDYPKQENEHNALADARWNKKLYEFLKANK